MYTSTTGSTESESSLFARASKRLNYRRGFITTGLKFKHEITVRSFQNVNSNYFGYYATSIRYYFEPNHVIDISVMFMNDV